MSVDPPKSDAPPNEDPDRSGPTSDALRPVDRTDEADRVPQGTMSPERMREVLRRLDQDHYSSADVQNQVALAVLRDLGLSRTVITP
jgi:hypothetical protein